MKKRPRHPAVTKYITRFDYGRSHGWLVRIQRQVAGKRTISGRLFSDGMFGGKEAALRAAVMWRDQQLLRLPPPKKRERTTGSGYVRQLGRSFLSKATGKRVFYQAWVAWVRMSDGKALSTNWSIPKWGDEEAKRRAQNWLRTKRRELRS